MARIIFGLLILNGVILIHELGHYIMARRAGVRVVEFSIGFGPRLLSFRWKGTRFSLKALLFGGSCNMQGEHDGTTTPGSFDSVSVGKRAGIIFAGPFLNFLLAFVASAFLVAFFGIDKPYIDTIDPLSPAYQEGLRKGDLIVSYDGRPMSNSREFLTELALVGGGATHQVTYARDGAVREAQFPAHETEAYILGIRHTREENVVTEIVPGSGAAEANILPGDTIVAVNGEPVTDGASFTELTDGPIPKEGVVLTLHRGETEIETRVIPEAAPVTSIGFEINRTREKTSDRGAIRGGLGEIRYYIRVTVRSVAALFQGQIENDDLAGPIGAVSALGGVYGRASQDGAMSVLRSTLSLLSLVSATVGLMNLIPFPALDGFQLLLFGVEATFKRPLDKKARTMINVVGFLFLMAFMVYFTIKDIVNLF